MEKQIKIHVDSLDCAACAATIGKAFEKIKIINHNVIIPLKEVYVNFDEEQIDEEQILKTLKQSGYKGKLVND
ncbi:heavy-metal-associated domain-containing protein [Spiroplasma tabanidicola]|uniref:Copper chaperone n=1 Tax=Spiroplasma tabanidicola TaxID=324079 RepID=A0A6I6C873_9MOLU|nr:heavy-metal-associated domain-containing protein [Spiroplasma tabanidicola]QGS52430.1 copper chaperone [Spiroplasma tabanidicola]